MSPGTMKKYENFEKYACVQWSRAAAMKFSRKTREACAAHETPGRLCTRADPPIMPAEGNRRLKQSLLYSLLGHTTERHCSFPFPAVFIHRRMLPQKNTLPSSRHAQNVGSRKSDEPAQAPRNVVPNSHRKKLASSRHINRVRSESAPFQLD